MGVIYDSMYVHLYTKLRMLIVDTCVHAFVNEILQLAWAVGSIMEALLALVVMTSIDHQPWRWLLGLSALPILVVILLFIVSDQNITCSMHYY